MPVGASVGGAFVCSSHCAAQLHASWPLRTRARPFIGMTIGKQGHIPDFSCRRSTRPLAAESKLQ